jgi:hypothetical protein
LLAIAAASAGFAQNPEFRARMAAWQQPQAVRSAVGPAAIAAEPIRAEPYYEESGGGWEEGSCGNCACDGSCGGECDGGCAGDYCGLRGFHRIGRDPACDACKTCRPPMWWLRTDGLLWWRKGRDLPVLVVSNTEASDDPGQIVLYGGDIEGGSPQGGIRIDLGTWLDTQECLGIGGRFWWLGEERTRFHADGDTLPDQTIERPFIDAATGPDSFIVSDPFTPFSGSIDVVTTSEIYGADAFARMAWCRVCEFRVDLLVGYEFTRINESLRIDTDIPDSPLGPNRAFDQWLTRNEFHGVSVGLLYESCRDCWTTTCLLKVGLGSMRQTAELSGGENGVPVGLLVEEPITVTRDEFAAVPELDLSWSYAINPCWNMNIGYSLVYWSSVARPEALIDDVVGNDTSLVFRDESLWVQGLTIGANCRF